MEEDHRVNLDKIDQEPSQPTPGPKHVQEEHWGGTIQYTTDEKQLALEAIAESRVNLGKLQRIVADASKAMEKWRKQLLAAMEYLENQEGFHKLAGRGAKRHKESPDKDSFGEDDFPAVAENS